jgi:hypothetical protein
MQAALDEAQKALDAGEVPVGAVLVHGGKIISRVWVEKTGISINNKNNWEAIFEFFYDNMDAFERFFYENQDYIKDLEINT